VGARPWGIGVSPDGARLFTANGPSGDVSIIDAATGNVTARVKVGGLPWGIAVAQGKQASK
jgi:YVTN family beta-propeller protein